MTRDEKIIEAYRGFTNVIDDYFEYRCKSPEDQEYVHRALGNLTDQLTRIVVASEEPEENNT